MHSLKKILSALFIIPFLFQNFCSKAQIDTSFWFAAPWVTPDHTERHNVAIHISTFGAPSTTVHLHQPAALAPNKYDTIMIIGPNQTFDYIFWRDKLAAGPPSTLTPNIGFDSLEVRPADLIVPYGLHISSSSSITVVYDVITAPPSFSNPETFSLKGQNALGLEFLCPQQTLYRNRILGDRAYTPAGILQPKQQIVIVASMANTIVWITPKCDIVGHLANVTYSILLPSAGSAYNIENINQDSYVTGKTLSGTSITSDKPIAVTVADDSINNAHSSPAGSGLSTWGGMGCYDLIGDQIVPITSVGKDYVVTRGQLFREHQLGIGNPGMKESAFIVATENLTQLTMIAGTSTITANLNKGDTYVDTLLTDLSYIHSNKNIYVYHVSGFGCELGSALLPPINCAGSKTVAFSRNTQQQFALNILCKNGAQSSFTLNGSPTLVPASSFSFVPGTSTLAGGPYYQAQVNLNSTTLMPVGSYTIANNVSEFALGVFDGGMASGGLYYYSSSFANKVNVKTATLSPLCANVANTVILTGTVSGASNQGIWTSANGNGSISSVYSSSNTIISTVYTLSPSDTLQTTLKFYLTSAGACRPIRDSILLTIHPNPKISLSSTNNISLCRNNLSPISLSGTVLNALGGAWSSSGTGSWGTPGLVTSYTLSSSDVVLPQLVFTLTSHGPLAGCNNSAKTLTVSFIDPAIVNAGSDITLCDKTFPGATLNGNISGITTTGIWTSSGTGTFLPGISSPTVSYLFSNADYSQTSIVFTLTSTNNSICASVSSTVVAKRDTSTLIIQPSSSTLCAGETVTLTASGIPNYSWSTSATLPQIIVTPIVTSSYSVSGTSTLNCLFYESTTLTVFQLPVVHAFSSDSVICVGEYLQLNASGAVNYTWFPTAISSSSLIITPTITTLYYLEGLDANGCKNIDSISVRVSECTGELKNKHTDGYLLIYPNPNAGEFMIQSEVNMYLSLFNEIGQLERILELTEDNDHKLNICGLTNGIYFIVNTTPQGVTVRHKIIVNK